LSAIAVIWLAAARGVFLNDALGLEPGRVSYLRYVLIVLFLVTLALLWRGKRSILDLCLMLTLWAWLLEAVLIAPPAERFSVGWYAGRVMGLLSGLFVLLMLLIEMSRLYARTVMLIAAQKRERENRLMLGEAVGAFIAHELRQPLAAIGLNAYTARQLGSDAGNELSGVLDDLMKDSRRASDIIESTRALFGDAAGETRPTDINQLILDTLLMASHELRNYHVRVELDLAEGLAPVAVNRMQMQQVFMNLFVNAAEAMSEVSGRARRLTVRSSAGKDRLIIRVEDEGPSMAAADEERMFEPFFTTKRHGTGMGLSICRSIVQAHGGSIRMVPRTPFGVAFEIVLLNIQRGMGQADSST
ncbi:MAG TPA: HAMP domain-containing sensor histidine kinase, partial [Rhizomicrobium sp.]|nr:HAMP domain-containing sensor histidine kinase [Rhizomicrobium sp.]